MKGRKGFSIVEVLIATVLIALGMVPLFSIFVSTASDISYTIDEVAALSCANELIEAVIARGFDALPGELAETEAGAIGGALGKALGPRLSKARKGFERFVSIGSSELSLDESAILNPAAKEKAARLKKIKIINVSVRYRQGSRPRELNLSTIVTGA